MIKDGTYILPAPGDRYKDNHGHVVTISNVSHNRVEFYRPGDVLCMLPGALFRQRFEFVEKGKEAAPVNLDHPLIARVTALRDLARAACR